MIPNPSRYYDKDRHTPDPLAPIEFLDHEISFGAPFDLLIPHLEKFDLLYETPGFICICGHPLDTHRSKNHYSCNGSIAIQCKCSGPNPIMDVEDTRFFFHETIGIMHNHALILGLDRLVNEGFKYSKMRFWKCVFCDEHEGPVFATAVDKFEYVSYISAHKDLLLCIACLSKQISKYDPKKSSRPKKDATYQS